jgi:hypothetical protein
MTFPSTPQSGHLPEHVIDPDTSLTALPESRPTGQIDIHELRTLFLGKTRDGELDGGPVVLSRNDPRLAEASQHAAPRPTDTRLGAVLRLTCIGER